MADPTRPNTDAQCLTDLLRACGYEPPDAAQGVWLAYYHDGSACVPFANEIEALRHALGASMNVKFVKFGDDDWMRS